MNKSFVVLATMASVTPQVAEAVQYAFQPRIEAGAMYYQYQQDAFTELTSDTESLFPGLPDNRVGFASQSGLKFNDVLPFVSGGGTAFIDQFYFDLSVQYADNGEDTAQTRRAEFFTADNDPGGAFQTTEKNSWDSDFDRIDIGISLGYVVTENFTVYAGYKYAKTDFDIKRSGDFRLDRCGDESSPEGIPPGCVTAPSPFSFTFTEDAELEFEQDGPFVGASFGTEIGPGTLTGNFAVAFLDATVKERSSNGVKDSGEPLDPIKMKFDGDTIGLSAGISWWGPTPIEDLRYLLAIDGYRYSYDGGENQDFSEELVRLKVGLAYTF
jgi:hypothetical protein